MQRGSDKHSPRKDDALEAELRGQLGGAGGHREEWRDPEPPADDDPALPARPDRGDAAQESTVIPNRAGQPGRADLA